MNVCRNHTCLNYGMTKGKSEIDCVYFSYKFGTRRFEFTSKWLKLVCCSKIHPANFIFDFFCAVRLALMVGTDITLPKEFYLPIQSCTYHSTALLACDCKCINLCSVK